ncbi:DUF7710 domain-containing protein [Micromonospora sp. NBC_01813]|uniref:DUF7710 domain-containing protein n=1 Tax=Micromonospora sp. NBC_01813 TaxID=2975988 RepID=UPI002DD8EDE7|nr:hypothetical protein [Micromonospora sp. NBC_01813]WSA07832.1 hypothetical protein OG958_26975 [Micromonospora sp. NBC_01813]
MAERLVLEAMAAVDGSLARWRAACDGLRDRDAFAATGVMGAYSDILPADALRDATTSMYAEIAHHLGWLELDRALTTAGLEQVGGLIGEWVTQDRTLPEVVETFGPPSLWIGGTNPYWPKTLAYTTADRNDDLICFHLWNTFANTAAQPGQRGVHPKPVLLAVRHRPGNFPDSFSFTPEGLRRRPTSDQRSPLRSTIWIFHGDRARHASGVFDTLDAALAWAAEHQVTGILTEYAYDAAISEGRFTPSRGHHGTADHVGTFSPGLRHLHLASGHPDE